MVGGGGSGVPVEGMVVVWQGGGGGEEVEGRRFMGEQLSGGCMCDGGGRVAMEGGEVVGLGSNDGNVVELGSKE